MDVRRSSYSVTANRYAKQVRKPFSETYYDRLEATQKGDLDVTTWLEWFLGCLFHCRPGPGWHRQTPIDARFFRAAIESIGSSTRIEGSKLTDREVRKLLSNLAIQSFQGKASPYRFNPKLTDRDGRTDHPAEPRPCRTAGICSAQFYRHHGFIALPAQQLFLFLPLATVKQMID